MNKFFKISVLLFISLLMISCGEQKASISFNAMDTFMTIQAYGKTSNEALESAKKLVLNIEQNISTTNSQSDLYKLNNGQQIKISKDTFTLAEYSLTFAKKTNGALNPALYPITSEWGFTTGNYKVPSKNKLQQLLTYTDFSKIKIEENYIHLEEGMALDFGAVGKGYTGDQVINLLKEKGIKSALLDLGGNIQALGKKTDGAEWNIGIKNPWTGTAAASIKIADKAVITSGGYERFFTADDGHDYIHIFDGKTGYPVENGIAGITIVTESGLYADALSTAMFVMGTKAASDFWKLNPDFEMIIFTEDKSIYYTEGLAEKLNLISDFTSVNIIHK